MALPDRQVRPSASNLAVKRDPRVVAFVLEVEETGGAKRLVQHRVVVLREGVEVLTKCTAQQLRLPMWVGSVRVMRHGDGETTDHLRDDGDARTEGVQINLVRRQPVVMDGAFCQDAAEKRQCQGALAAARTADWAMLQ